jgi:hypothetical protein
MAMKENEEALKELTNEWNEADDDLQGECGSRLLAPKWRRKRWGNVGVGSMRGRE